MKKMIRPMFLLTLLLLAQGVKLPENPPIDIAAVPVTDLFDLRYGSYGVINYYKFGIKRAVQYRGKPVKYLAFSPSAPSESKLGFFSESSNQGNAEDISLVILDMGSREFNTVFTGNRIGSPQWLGKEYVFFTAYCGTSCQGLYLVNTLNKEARLAVLSYMVIDPNRPSYTHFRDWFDREFEFNGLVDEITSEAVEGKSYLLFKMKNDEGKFISEKRFLFTAKRLEEK